MSLNTTMLHAALNCKALSIEGVRTWTDEIAKIKNSNSPELLAKYQSRRAYWLSRCANANRLLRMACAYGLMD